MDREILFRGKRLDNGEWVEGSYMEHYYSSRFGCVSAIFTNDDVLCKTYRISVDPSTVGQYTGLTDKNGKRIFEGDICRVGNFTYQVVFQHSQWWFSITTPGVYCNPYFDSHCGEYCEIIGNIHDNDNPELIGGDGDG